MEKPDSVCRVCGRTKPTNRAGVAVSCCSRLTAPPMTAEEYSSILRVLRERVDLFLVACAGHVTASPLLGCALVAAVGVLIVVALSVSSC